MQSKKAVLMKTSLFTKNKFKNFNLLRNWYYFFSSLYLLLLIVLIVIGIISLVSPDFIIKDANEIYHWPLNQDKDIKGRTLSDVINSVNLRSYNLYIYSIISVFIPFFFILYNSIFLFSYLFMKNDFKKLGLYFFVKKSIIKISFWTLSIIFIFSLISAIWNIFSILYFEKDWIYQIDQIKLFGTSESYEMEVQKNIYSIAIFIFPILITLSILVSLIIWNVLDKHKK